MIILFCQVLLCEGYNRWVMKEWGMGKVFILLGIHDITRRRVQRRHSGGGGSKYVNGWINHQLLKFTPLGLVSWVTVMYFAPWGEEEKQWGLMPLGLFLSYTRDAILTRWSFFHRGFGRKKYTNASWSADETWICPARWGSAGIKHMWGEQVIYFTPEKNSFLFQFLWCRPIYSYSN